MKSAQPVVGDYSSALTVMFLLHYSGLRNGTGQGINLCHASF